MNASRPESVRPAHLASYVPDARRYDELLDANGEIRSQWQPLLEKLARDNAREEARRSLDLTRRLIVENGVTYNIYADPQGADRPWTLDPLPFVLTAAEWSEIERGVAQRAQLLDTLLADLYGQQRLLAEGLVPPALAFGHPNFLWPCHGIVPRDGQWLHVYAADLARAPDGRWWILADRTQAPSGAGYALENREIVEQVLPDTIRDLRVRGVREFFEDFRERMLGFADGEQPLGVILTPGPFNETYFEHAYLARQLGLALAEGHDLTVREDTVYLKTLAGLKRVHTIYRRLDDDYCDPVELRSDSALGVPGLLGAVRAGRVVLANALGTGVLESAAWHGFMPGVAERLLGESLALPSVATWWCGEKPALDYVLANLDHLVLKPTYPNQRFEPVFGNMLEGAARDEVIKRLRARPYAYVAQEHVALSQAPVWRTGGAFGLAAKAFMLRVYAVTTPRGWVVMPGGLARVATETAVDVVSTQRGGGSKDVWILSSSSASESSAPRTDVLAHAAARRGDIASRLVENLYWFGRYTVRCEDKARLLRATLAARPDESLWRGAVKICRELGVIAADVDAGTSLRDERNPYGIIADVRRLGWCASQVRSRLSSSHWRAIIDLQRQLQEAVTQREESIEALDRLLLSLAAIAGFAFDHMTRDEGWRLLRVGRRLERLQLLASLLAQHLLSDTPTRATQVEWVLNACDSGRVYRSRYAVAPRVGPMLDLLLRDAEHPRALAFQWQTIAKDIATLAAALGNSSELRLDIAVPALDDNDLLALERSTDEACEARRHLAARLQTLSGAAGELSDRLSMRYFSHTGLDSYALAT
ncbi:MAG: circularly permuted type 2 ATP-grasp protein [Steroidobacteraceae bacterium]